MDVPTSPPDPSPPPAGPPDALQPLPLKRRNREEASDDAGPDAEILALAGRLQALIGSRRDEDRTRESNASPRENRLRPRQPATPATPDEEILAVLAEARAATSPRGRKYDRPDPAAHLEAIAGRWLRRALWPGLCVLAALLAFALGRSGGTPEAADPRPPVPARVPAPPAAVAPPAPPRWSEKSLATLDDLLSARRAGDPTRAAVGARALRTQEGALPGLDLFAAESLLHANHPSEATTALLLLLRADQPVAVAAARLGFIAARSRQLDEAAGYFETASTADPFRGDLLARWAEALRRQGKPGEAINRFTQALLRPADDEGARPAPPETAFHRRLARLEAGEIEPVRKETTDALAGPATPETGRWLLTAAALELLDNHPAPAVAAALAKARAALPAAEWDRLSGDLFFRNYAGHAGLTEFLPPAGSAADAKRVKALGAQPDLDFVDP